MKIGIEEYVSINLNKPENLVLEDLIKPELPFFIPIRRDDGSSSHYIKTGKKIRKHIPTLYFFVHVLLERQHSDVDVLRCWFAKDFVEMFSRDIEPIKSKNDFRFIWGILRALKVIEYHDETKPNKYKKSAKAYFFKLTDKYENSKVVQHQIKIKSSLADKLNHKWGVNRQKVGNKIDLSVISTNKQLAHQYYILQKIIFDAEAAKQLSNELLFQGTINIKQYNSFQISINGLENHRINISRSPVCDRFFTPVTSMPSELRQFIYDNEGKSLIELDFGSFNAFAVYKILNSFTPEYKTNAEKIAYENEVDLYRRLLSGGDFYNDFKDVFLPLTDLTRDQIKDIVLKRWFNGKLNSRNKYRKHLQSRLPQISTVIDCLKVEKYKNFSYTTMKMESELINDIIYRIFIERNPEVIMYTIFDSFLVEQKHSSELQALMLEEGSKYFTINCIVRSKNPQNV